MQTNQQPQDQNQAINPAQQREGGELQQQGQRHLPGDMESRYAEVQQQFYQRTFSLSKELDAEQATAELKNGVLRVRIPKTQQAQPRKIQITSA